MILYSKSNGLAMFCTGFSKSILSKWNIPLPYLTDEGSTIYIMPDAVAYKQVPFFSLFGLRGIKDPFVPAV